MMKFIAFIRELFTGLFVKPEEVITHPMNDPVQPPTAPNSPVAAPNPDTLSPWTSMANNRHNVRVIADLEGLNLKQKNDLSATIHCESNYNPKCIHPNLVNGKVSSIDFGICQINDFFHIGSGKDFSSSDYVLNNPEACVRWMARQFKAGNAHLWVCYSKSLYTHYSS